MSEVEMYAANENSWWMIPENFESPFVFFIDEDQEQHIFGHGDEYLRCIEENSNTFIQLEGWFTASGQTRVTVVGPFRAKHWLVDMIWNLCNEEAYHRARGQEMLDLVRKQPLTRAHLDASLTVQAGPFLDIKDLVTTWD